MMVLGTLLAACAAWCGYAASAHRRWPRRAPLAARPLRGLAAGFALASLVPLSAALGWLPAVCYGFGTMMLVAVVCSYLPLLRQLG